MSTVSTYGFTDNMFPGGHYIHPFHNQAWGDSGDGSKEHPRTVEFLFVTP